MDIAVLGVVAVIVVIIFMASVRVVQEYERGVIFRLGRVVEGAKGPGLFFIIPIIDKMVKVNLQIVTLDVPPQDVISKVDLDTILGERDRLNGDLQRIIDDLTDPWGVKVALVEIKDVDLPVEMQRAMAKQAEAERERRARIINAEGEFQASERLAQAAEVISRHPIAYQLRYLQTVTDVSAEKNSTLVIPIPIELLAPFKAAFGEDASAFDAAQEAKRRSGGESP